MALAILEERIDSLHRTIIGTFKEWDNKQELVSAFFQPRLRNVLPFLALNEEIGIPHFVRLFFPILNHSLRQVSTYAVRTKVNHRQITDVIKGQEQGKD